MIDTTPKRRSGPRSTRQVIRTLAGALPRTAR